MCKRVDYDYCRKACTGCLQYADVVHAVVNGVDVNPIDYTGITALHLASSEGHTAQMRWLLAMGANVNELARDKGVFTESYPALLETTSFSPNHESMKLLLEAGAEVDWTRTHNFGPLMQLSIVCQVETDPCVQTLLLCPATDLTFMYDHETAEDVARNYGKMKLARQIAIETKCRRQWTKLRAAWIAACTCRLV